MKNQMKFNFILIPLIAFFAMIATPFLASAYTAPTGTPSISMLGVSNVTSNSAVVSMQFSENNATYTWAQEPQMTIQYTGSNGQVMVTQEQGVLMGDRTLNFNLINLQPNSSYSYVGIMQYNGLAWDTNSGSFITLNGTATTATTSNTTSSNTATTTTTSSTTSNTSSNTIVNTNPTISAPNIAPVLKSVGNFFGQVKQDAINSVATGGSTTKDGVTLAITDDAAKVNIGDTVDFKVEYLNSNAKDLQNGVLVVTLPPQYVYQESSYNAIPDDGADTVTFHVGRIPAGQVKTITLTAKAVGDGSGTVSTVATLSYKGGSLMATDHDNYQTGAQDVLGASVFGAGFFPSSFLGWMLVILLLGLVVYIARRYVKSKDKVVAQKPA